MLNPTVNFIQKMFLKYYKECFDEIYVPTLFEKREFGALLFKEKIMIRHKKFETAIGLKNFLCSIVPSDVYFSSAYYEQPDAPEMTAKDWTGADLIFDIDADHLSTPCKKTHDIWICSECNFANGGIAPEKCPNCGKEKLSTYTWPCKLCVNAAKKECIKLLEILTRDFGFSKQETRIYFSGHRGYHVQVENEAIRSLDSSARREIVDYVCGLGLDFTFYGLHEESPNTLKGLKSLNFNESGWRGRIARGVYDFVLNANMEDYKTIGLEKHIISAIMNNKNTILKSWGNAETWGVVKKVGFENWKKIVEFCVRSQSANVDTVVTTDIHRLIRLTGTLHGKTGLKKIEVPLSEIEDFDPFKSAVAFKNGSATVLVHHAPEFRLGEETFGPYKDQKVELPIAAAILLICKNRAEVTDYNV